MLCVMDFYCVTFPYFITVYVGTISTRHIALISLQYLNAALKTNNVISKYVIDDDM